MKSFYLTDTGRVRSHNEDSVTIVKNASGEHLMIVADGMGGHRAGEIASSMVVTQIGTRFSNLSTIGSKMDAVKWLKENVDEVNASILKYGEEHPESMGLGTTVVMALLTKDFLIFVNIGDSSGYVLKNKVLHKITKEHTLVNFLVETGELTPEEAINHPKKNVLMKALGASEKQELDIFDVDPNVDAILLVTDGLTNMVSEEKIFDVVTSGPEKAADILIQEANEAGGYDNITVVIIM